ncbi:hypothetical protein CMESO_108 (nucleomorph) [Chroomonas mesostigmatica CCMP1168]|uniref:Uncharacterized protein n=1 Tax=Chroomonas mesostigmatica CCMP1168 TaxID=1195612 RepID=J7G5F4_9CRYP|nr:hypothetical protein CMESO_108 [Chroomonas mesostigmatica CCMP1168]
MVAIIFFTKTFIVFFLGFYQFEIFFFGGERIFFYPYNKNFVPSFFLESDLYPMVKPFRPAYFPFSTNTNRANPNNWSVGIAIF